MVHVLNVHDNCRPLCESRPQRSTKNTSHVGYPWGELRATSKRACKTDVPRTSAHIYVESARRHFPRLTAHIPVAQVFPTNVECDRLGCAWCQGDFLEPTQLLGW